MKIKVTEPHHFYEKGTHEVDDERGKYLIRMGIAEEAKSKKKDDETGVTEATPSEKVEKSKTKEKAEGVKHTPKNEK